MSDIKEHKQLEGIRICTTIFTRFAFIFRPGGVVPTGRSTRANLTDSGEKLSVVITVEDS